jgi:hypothetical protein
MLYWPRRLPLSNSRRFCGGILKSSSRTAISNCRNFRSYTLDVDKPRYALAFVQRLSVGAFE